MVFEYSDFSFEGERGMSWIYSNEAYIDLARVYCS